MKLSNLSTDQALDVLCRLTPLISNITSDTALVETLGKVVNAGEGLNKYGSFMLVAERLGESIPILLKTHREDVYGILSILNEKGPEEVAKQNLLETLRQLREVFQDKELMAFFKSFTTQEDNG